MKITDIREAVGHAKRFLTHAEWVLRNSDRTGMHGSFRVEITDVCGGPGFDVMQDAARDLRNALRKFRKRREVKES